MAYFRFRSWLVAVRCRTQCNEVKGPVPKRQVHFPLLTVFFDLKNFNHILLLCYFRKRVNSNLSFEQRSQFSYCNFLNFRKIHILSFFTESFFNYNNNIPFLPPELQEDRSLKTTF